MSKKKSAKRVPLPDINALAEKSHIQQKQNTLEALTANRADQSNPFGSIDWTRDATTGEWTQTEKYNPEQQALLDQRVKTQGIVGKEAEGLASGIDYDYSGAPAMPTPGGYVAEATDALRKLQEPEMARREAADRARRAAMGLQGGERIVATSEQNLADARDRADLQAILKGYERGDTMFEQGMAGRQMYTGEQDQMLSNLGGMMGGSAPQGLEFGDYAQQGTVNAPDYAGNAMQMWEAQQGQENARAASKKSGLMGGLGTLAGAGIGFMAGNPMLGAKIGGAAGSMFDK